jgi:hypothetical protein
MPAKKRTVRAHHESPKLIALAFSDAMRDILSSDGKFHLGDDRTGDAVWEWDGVSWSRIPLVDRHSGRSADEPPYVEVERDDDLAVAG